MCHPPATTHSAEEMDAEKNQKLPKTSHDVTHNSSMVAIAAAQNAATPTKARRLRTVPSASRIKPAAGRTRTRVIGCALVPTVSAMPERQNPDNLPLRRA